MSYERVEVTIEQWVKMRDTGRVYSSCEYSAQVPEPGELGCNGIDWCYQPGPLAGWYAPGNGTVTQRYFLAS